MVPMAVLLAAVMFTGDGGSGGGSGDGAGGAKALPRVAFETSMGKFVLELEAEKAPKTVENFLAYVRAGHYDGTIFHRVIRGFMIQGGGFDADMRQKPTRSSIANEAVNGLRNKRGSVAMARTMDPHSASAQFFVNTVDNRPLDYSSSTPQGWGYAVFGRVVEGMDVVDKIEGVRTASKGGHGDVPVEPVVVRKASIVE